MKKTNNQVGSKNTQNEVFDPVQAKASANAVRKQGRLLGQVLRVIRQFTGISDLEPDRDGDFSLMYSNIPIYLLIRAEPPRLQYLSPLVDGVNDGDTKLLKQLNVINTLEHRLQVFVANGCVHAKREIRLSPFHGDQISNTLIDFSRALESVKASLDVAFMDSKADPGVALSRAIH